MVKKSLWVNQDQSEIRNCGKVEVAILGSLSLIVLMVFVDLKQH